MMKISPSFLASLVLGVFCLVLVLRLLGFLPLFLIAIFLLSAAGFGWLVCPKYLQERNPLLRLALFIVVGLQLLGLLFLFLRMVFPTAEKVVFFSLLFCGLAFLLFRGLTLIQNYRGQTPIKFYRGLTPILALGFLALCLLLVSNLMAIDNTSLYFQDAHHPIYELSIARAVELSVPPKDLSFLGKPLQFHFLSSILVSLFDKDLGLNSLDVVYRVLPFLAVGLFLALSFYLGRIIGLKKRLALFSPFLFLFFYPFVLPLPAKFSLWPTTFKTLIASPSYSMGFLGLLALLILILETIKQKKNFSWLACVLGVALFMTKASFFIPLGLAVGLFFLQRAVVEKKFKPLLFPFSMLVCVLPFYYFLAGAHSHNLWILAPDALIFKRLPDFLYLNNSLPALPLMFLASPFIFYGFFSLIYFFGFFRFWKNKKVISLENFLIIVMVVSCSFPFFLSEATEGNVRQFLLPGVVAMFPLALLWLNNLKLKRAWLFGFVVVAILGVVSSQVVNKTYVFLQKPKTPSYSLDLAQALMFLNKNSSPKALVLFGKHYESPDWEKRQYIGQWDYLSFFRTALSGRQTIVEDFKYRGIGMEEAYNTRSLENLAFFFNVVKRTPTTSPGWFVPPGFVVPEGHREEQANLWFVKPLRLSRGPNWFSIRKSYPQFLEENWPSIVQDNVQWLSDYLDFYHVNYILFERGERPDPELVPFLKLKLVFEQNDVALYQREF